MKNVRRLHDDELYDEVRIGIVPRYKTSTLSGNEWRTVPVLPSWKAGPTPGVLARLTGYRTEIVLASWKAGLILGVSTRSIECQLGPGPQLHQGLPGHDPSILPIRQSVVGSTSLIVQLDRGLASPQSARCSRPPVQERTTDWESRCRWNSPPSIGHRQVRPRKSPTPPGLQPEQLPANLSRKYAVLEHHSVAPNDFIPS